MVLFNLWVKWIGVKTHLPNTHTHTNSKKVAPQKAKLTDLYYTILLYYTNRLDYTVL